MSATKASYAREMGSLFVKFMRDYRECSDDVQRVIDQMVEIVNSRDADEQEREMALETLTEALFPEYDDGNEGDQALGLEVEEAEKACVKYKPGAAEAKASLDQQEHEFADRLRQCMIDKNLSQTELADRIGVTQPAISMMLNRNCRPQARTVRQLAEALDVTPEQLWPTSVPEEQRQK